MLDKMANLARLARLTVVSSKNSFSTRDQTNRKSAQNLSCDRNRSQAHFESVQF